MDESLSRRYFQRLVKYAKQKENQKLLAKDELLPRKLSIKLAKRTPYYKNWKDDNMPDYYDRPAALLQMLRALRQKGSWEGSIEWRMGWGMRFKTDLFRKGNRKFYRVLLLDDVIKAENSPWKIQFLFTKPQAALEFVTACNVFLPELLLRF